MKKVDRSHKSAPRAVSRLTNGCQEKIDGDIGNNRKPSFSHASILFIIAMLGLSMFAGGAGAATVTYSYLPSTGATVATGVTTNFNCPSTYPTVYSKGLLTTAATGGCNATRQYAELDPSLDTFYNTAYAVDTTVTGKWVYSRLRDGLSSGSGGTFTFRLIYIYPNGTIATLPGTAVTQNVAANTNADYNLSLSGISGVVPAGAKLGLRVSLTGSSTDLRYYVGDSAAASGGASGIFSVTETPAGGGTPTYNISGYIKNASSGLPLSGATVETNTSVSNITNAAGYYILKNLTNGTYFVNASLAEYETNSTTKTISGANVNNWNISLVPDVETVNGSIIHAPSVYMEVRNASGYLLSSATDTSYNYQIPNGGSLLVDASSTDDASVKFTISGPSTGSTVTLQDNETTNTVGQAPPGTIIKYVEIGATGMSFSSAEVKIYYTTAELGILTEDTLIIYHWNGASWDALPTTVDSVNNVLTATTTSLSPFAVSGGTASGIGSKILVATNRYVILDDPKNTTSGALIVTGSGFTLPGLEFTTWNNWAGKTTIINATALYIDENGASVNGSIITFTLFNPNGTIKITSNANTNSFGLANVSFEMNGSNFYGRWNIRAENGTIGQNTTFIYNWWGCSFTTSPCNYNHPGNSRNPTASGSASVNSPYATGRDTTVNSNSAHYGVTTNCTFCHQSYDGKTGGAWANWNNQSSFSTDVHRNIRCDNASCHPTLSVHRTNAQIASCYNTTGGCHTSRADISNKSTLSTATVSSALSLYSINSTSSNATFHTPNSTVPCIICHGPMHNISKPNRTLWSQKNSETESSHCTTCHTSYTNHNSSNTTSGGVNCTLCHSDDVHNIQVFSWQQSKFVNYSNTTYRGNCTTCHQNNNTFFNALKWNQTTNPKGANYSGRYPPLIINLSWTQKQIKHSDDLSSGTKYRQYWDWTQNKASSCNYCHGFTNHKSSALGRPGLFKNGNTVNSSIGDTTWCISCHNSVYQNYSDMISTFWGDFLNIPPSIIKGTTYYVSGKDHSSFGTNDSTCYSCHNGTNTYSTITQFMHGVYVGGGGPDCLKCHDMGKNGSILHVNNSVMKISMHKNLNNQSVNGSGISADNKKCWGCHQSDGSQPGNTSMGDMYSRPYSCFDCHKNDVKPYANVSNASSVTNHIDVDTPTTRIHALNATCYSCHNNSVNLGIANITDIVNVTTQELRIVSAKESISHYGTKSSLIDSIGNITTSQGCIYCHYNATNAAIWGQPRDPRNTQNLSQSHTIFSSNSQCFQCHLQNESIIPKSFHNDSLYYAGAGKILVATNRWVVLDDPNTAGAKFGTGFAIPNRDWGTNYWSGKNTIINASALYINRYGEPVPNAIVSFTIYWPNGTAFPAVNTTTNAYGLANFSFDLNNRNYYGNWKIRASNGSLGGNTTFIYNWWGCTFSFGSGCSGHNSEDPSNYGATTANSPYLSGRDTVTQRSVHQVATCTVCHQSFDGLSGGTNSGTNRRNNASDVHRNISCSNAACHGDYSTAHNSNQLVQSCYNSGCHGNGSAWDRKDISNKSTLSSGTVSTAVSIYSNSSSSFNATFHTPNSTVPCIICHGPMHAITKPDPANPIRNSVTEYNQCKVCHQAYVLHNNKVECPVCHSDDIHAIKVFAQNGTFITLNHNNHNPATGNCTSCHQNSSLFPRLINTTLNPKAGNYTGRLPPQVQTPVNHSNVTQAGAKWNQTPTAYWNRSDQLSWCAYCHNNEVHSNPALGRIALFKGTNTINSTIGNTSWCASCHWQGYSSGSSNYSDMVNMFNGWVPPEITGHPLYGANQSNLAFFNHNTLNKSDSSCKTCHGSLLAANVTTMTRFVHNVAVGTMGGPNCISCHDVGATGAESRINSTAMNGSLAIHKNLNSNATNSTGVPAANKKCWGCHQSNGSEPSGMGDRFGTPYKCFDCHRTTNKAYTNVSNAPSVSQHFKNGNDIKSATGADDSSTSCLICHNLSEMKVSYAEDDGYSTNYSLPSHYGKTRSTDPQVRLGSSSNCTYCHRNTSTAFTVAMVDASYSTNIINHSLRYNSTNPGCTSSQCHNTGWIHNSTLTKPALAIPDSTLCLSCHGDNGSGGTIYTGAVTSVKAEHNNSIACTECHLSTVRDVHGVKYLQSNSIFNNSNSTAVNCMICHQQATAVDSNLSRTPPKIVSPMHHSNNISNGSIWNTSYWTGSSPITACIYCHNDSKHDSSALGRPANWKGNNIVNSTISVTSNWCAGCHWQGYVSGSKNYNDMVNKFLSSSLMVPPEITGNATYAPKTKPGYINHSDFGKFDSSCKGCHGMNATGSNITGLMHNAATGISGGPDCINCHDKTGSGSNLKVNNSVMNSSSSVHRDLNNNATATGVSAENKKCWGCHQTNGTQPGGNSMGDRVSAPYTCIECHSPSKPYVNVSTAPNVSQHMPSADRVTTAASCSNCHNNSADFTLANIIDPRVITLEEKVSHYGTNTSLFDTVGNTNASQGCLYCHFDPVNSAIWGNAPDPRNSAIRPHSETSNNDCYACHIVGGINVANSMDNFHNDPLYSVNRYTHNPIPARNATASMIFSRKVILDDPIVGQNGTGFAAPNPYPWNGADYWNGESTTLRAYSLIMNTSGLAANGADVTFVLKEPDGTIINQTNVITGSDGIAPYVYDMNAKNFYGNWTLNVSAIVEGSYANSSVQFIYNWWGCAQCHTERNVTSYGIVTSRSPYLEGYDRVHINGTNHINRVNTSDCIYCHRSYGNGSAGSQYTTDMHQNQKTCQGCHTGTNGTNGTPVMPSCTQCHNSTTNSNLSYKSTLSGNLSIYSGSPMIPLKSHNSDQELPCVICHDSMHKITTPYPAGQGNSITEMQNCITCHINSNHTKNKPGLDCTKCHSQDAHAIKFITNLTTTGTANYSVNRSSAARCEECHNNSGLNLYFVASGFSPKKNDSLGYNFTKHNNIVSCNTCHDRIHWIGYLNTSGSYNISKTSVVGCIDCHNATNNGVKNATEAWGYVIPAKYKHNNSISCETCHASSKHGVRYLQQDKVSFGTKTNAVNCTSCHWQGYSGAIQVPKPLKHSNNISNGSVWGSFWTNSSPATACVYCHSDSKHSMAGLGAINSLLADSNNTKNGTLTTTMWCADCHYNDPLNTNYMGNLWNPVPPTITINNTGKNNWVNHSGFLNGAYKDNDCKSCHSINGSGTTSLNYSHSLNEGIAGGPNCVGCHSQGGIAGENKAVNLTAMNDSNAVHKDLNSNAMATNLTENKKCWACHGSGIEPTSGHPANYKTPYQCPDCHITGGIRAVAYPNATKTYRHYDGANVYGRNYWFYSIVNCSECHKNSLVANGSFNISQYSAKIDGNLTNVSHYATKNGLVKTNESFGCNQCHKVGNGGFYGPNYGNAGTLSDSHNEMAATTVACQICHNKNMGTNVTLHNNSVEISWKNCNYPGCHDIL